MLGNVNLMWIVLSDDTEILCSADRVCDVNLPIRRGRIFE